MQFKVPQNVQIADKIVGPLTLRHMIILGAGGGFAYLIYVILSRSYFWEVWLPPVGIIVIITLFVAFVKLYNLSFGRFFVLFIEFNLIPRKRRWIKASAELLHLELITKKTAGKQKERVDKSKEFQKNVKKLEKLSKILDKYGEEIETTKNQSLNK